MFLDTRRRGCCQVVYCKKNKGTLSRFLHVLLLNSVKSKSALIALLKIQIWNLVLVLFDLIYPSDLQRDSHINNVALFTMTDVS